jgi:ATP-dependent helicase HepA
MWRPGSKLVHPFNPELGVGLVRAIEGRFLTVYFPAAEREITMAAEGAELTRLVLNPGARAWLLDHDEEVSVAEVRGHRYLLTDGREVDDAELWPLEATDSPIDRLATHRLDPLGSFQNRIAGLELMTLREAGGLGSFLGGRIELFPHQLHTALRAVEQDPVRWLLADEVGLGKTIEACLIISALLRTGRAQGALIITPSTLTVQWLGELYRKFHQVFALLDHARIESVASDYGEGVNPFEVHPFSVISLEMLASDRRLCRSAGEVDFDLMVVDEAHRLAEKRFGGPLTPLLEQTRHALLLTATPLQADRRGFFGLLSLLHPESFCSFEAFDQAIETGSAVLPCVSAVRRADLEGLPERLPIAVDLPPPTEELSEDPRARWIAARVRDWLKQREKTLIFVHDKETLEALQGFLEAATRTRMTVFHEDLSVARRDIEVASFRETNAPVLLCTEAGTEGRNFQFCDRMIHYDLPLDPILLEQRIGRLDRIGRTGDVEIIYFRHPHVAPDVARLYERLDLFARSSAGLDAALDEVRPALEAAVSGEVPLDIDALVTTLNDARERRVHDVPRVLYRDGYDSSDDEEILARVPEDLEQRNREFGIGAARDLGLNVVEKGGVSLYYVELGRGATVDSLPGVPEESRYLGTFDRTEAIRKDEVDFFASGHPLVEGLLLELEDGNRGRAAMFEIPETGLRAEGLLCVYKEGPTWQAVAVDTEAQLAPELAKKVLAFLPRARPIAPAQLGYDEGWAEKLRRLGGVAQNLEMPGRLVAAALFRLS